MEINYEQIKEYMVNYCTDYSSYAQDTETMPRMDTYWTPDIIVTAYMQLKGGKYPLRFDTRTDWQNFLIEGHRKIWETLIPKEIMIDMNEMKVVVMLQIKKYDRSNKKLLCDLDGIGYYKLTANESHAPQIKTLDFFCGDTGKLTSLYNI
jgi:hypothetical protein